jgi:nucleoside-diphosphate-sugar epimerase
MRIVVIGATGHIGTWLVPRLVRAGHDVVAVSRGTRAPYQPADEWTAVETRVVDRTAAETKGSFGRTIASLGGDVVLDLICFTPESAKTLVEALRGRVGLFVHCGTLWVHGIPRTRPYDETAPREPFGDYGIRKAAIERYLLEAAAGGFPATILHPGHITGPGWAPINPAGHLDVGVFDALSRGATVVLPNDGQATLQHVHADDVAQAFDRAVARSQAAIGEAFHVAAAQPVTLRAYAEAVAGWFGREAQLGFLPWEAWSRTASARDAALTRDHVLHSPHASIDKARRLLNFEPRYSSLTATRGAIAAIYPDRLID